ncbi:translationally-controlled tumor protein homolog [Plakobranchus ocellatus]|uniref:Translationally-controlled tumor protein homolog n=1 Tax=Plakobranchus ocellatus TaxID=259542 RepID=A0AAV3XSH9_9GAST|nr:translationally-controlled tumor protein homolog [Plakobranchus ocellatus]
MITLIKSETLSSLKLPNWLEKLDPNVADPDTLLDIAVSYEESWLTRGHTSLIWVGCVIDVLTDLALDAHVMCSHSKRVRVKILSKRKTQKSLWIGRGNILDREGGARIFMGRLV